MIGLSMKYSLLLIINVSSILIYGTIKKVFNNLYKSLRKVSNIKNAKRKLALQVPKGFANKNKGMISTVNNT